MALGLQEMAPHERVKNVSKRVKKNQLAFFAAILCILMEHLAIKGFHSDFNLGERIWSSGARRANLIVHFAPF